MGEFERANDSGAWAVDDETEFPADFSLEEAAFAAELRDLFDPEREELPPLFAQTLIENDQHAVIEQGFEHKVAYQVLRRLDLPRAPLVSPRVTFLRSLGESVRQMSRPVMSSLSALLVTMLLTSVLAAPSFAAGLHILLAHTGVVQVQRYPGNVHTSGTMAHPRAQQSDIAMIADLQWFGPQVGSYAYSSVSFSVPQSWSNGPVADVEYAKITGGQGSGLIDIREFRPAASLASVLQVVAVGAATPVTIAGMPAVYVDGRWTSSAGRPSWQWGTQSELICERNGLILWITADQRDNIGQNDLIAMATMLAPAPVAKLAPSQPSLRFVGEELQGSLQNPTEGEVLALVPLGASPDSTQVSFIKVLSGISGVS